LFEGVSVTGVQVEEGRVSGVSTNHGDIECEIFINCAGQVSSSYIDARAYETMVKYWLSDPIV